MKRIDLKKLIAESREIAEALDEFADKLEILGMAKELDEFADKYADKLKEIAAEKVDKHKYSNNSFPYFMEELTEDDLEKRENNDD